MSERMAGQKHDEIKYAPQDFFVRSPSYYSATLTDESHARNLFIGGRVKIDCNCNFCEKESVFHNLETALLKNPDTKFHLLHGNHIIQFLCQRCHIHKLAFAINLTSDATQMQMGYKPFASGVLRKFGQSVSHADLHKNELKAFQRILSSGDLSEITRARGLASANVNIGAFVYLRRVFERLINEAYNSSPGVCEREKFHTLRMDEKIKTLKDLLPDFLVQNKRIYSVISKGIHELSEEECGHYYSVIHESILLMLDEALAKKERMKKMQTLTAEIAEIDEKTKKAE